MEEVHVQYTLEEGRSPSVPEWTYIRLNRLLDLKLQLLTYWSHIKLRSVFISVSCLVKWALLLFHSYIWCRLQSHKKSNIRAWTDNLVILYFTRHLGPWKNFNLLKLLDAASNAVQGHGCRKELALMLDALKPGFLRFPGTYTAHWPRPFKFFLWKSSIWSHLVVKGWRYRLFCCKDSKVACKNCGMRCAALTLSLLHHIFFELIVKRVCPYKVQFNGTKIFMCYIQVKVGLTWREFSLQMHIGGVRRLAHMSNVQDTTMMCGTTGLTMALAFLNSFRCGICRRPLPIFDASFESEQLFIFLSINALVRFTVFCPFNILLPILPVVGKELHLNVAILVWQLAEDLGALPVWVFNTGENICLLHHLHGLLHISVKLSSWYQT